MSYAPWRAAAAVAGAAFLASCTSDLPTISPPASASSSSSALAPAAGKVQVCHRPAQDGRIIEIGAASLAAHLAHGDYLSTLLVSHESEPPDDGAHFATIGGALASAAASRAAAGETVAGACRITIVVSAGTYRAPSEPRRTRSTTSR